MRLFTTPVSEYLSQSILLEVCTAPKPGLVTRLDNGAHGDMSLVTFMLSSVVIGECFRQLEELGQTFQGPVTELLPAVRRVGVVAEQHMFETTQGVNTQKGILFAGGLTAAAAGYLEQKQQSLTVQNICATVAAITAGIVERELCKNTKQESLTAGEKLYRAYGITGIRREVEEGFPSVREVGLPALRAAFEQGLSINDALVQTLLALMSIVDDTNVIWRTDVPKLLHLKQQAAEALALGGVRTAAGRSALAQLESYCVQEHMSPGGSADLLSITLTLYLVENKQFPVPAR